MTQAIHKPRFASAVEEGDVVEQSGYHQPNDYDSRRRTPRCGCSDTTPKGAYRDVEVALPDGRTVHFYHQSPVVVQDGAVYRLDSCGYRTPTTKSRINEHTPHGVRVYQRDFEWFVDLPDASTVAFEDGMTIDMMDF